MDLILRPNHDASYGVKLRWIYNPNINTYHKLYDRIRGEMREGIEGDKDAYINKNK